MSDYGIAISQNGYDVKTCADRFLAYSSAFQGLKVFSKTTLVIPAESDGIITHNLGYLAPFMVFGPDGSLWYGTQTTTTLTITNGYGVQKTVYVFIFADDFSTVAEKVVNTSTGSGSPSSNHGMKVSQEGYDVKTCTDSQLMFSSSHFTALMDKKGTVVSTSDFEPVTISHGLGYPADFLVFTGSDVSISPFFGNSIMNICEIDSSALSLGIIEDLPLGMYAIGIKFFYIILKCKLN